MNISETFIRRPIGTSLLMAGMLVFGIASSGSTTTSGYPSDVILGLRGLLG